MKEKGEMISVFQENDALVWIPVAAANSDGPPRAFLPFSGIDGTYTYGYKASPSRGKYFDALRAIQQAYLQGESQVFRVQNGKKERQKKAKWRHGNKKGSPLLGPTLGWAAVPLTELETVSDTDLGKALLDSGNKFAVIVPTFIEPVLCESVEQLVLEAEKLKSSIAGKQPIGQRNPKKLRNYGEQYARDAAVVAYVLNISAGICECCEKPAPFAKSNGEPYLEVHHVRPLAAGGSDTVMNAVALCPNCHRELHHGRNSVELIEKLYSRLDRLVRESSDAQPLPAVDHHNAADIRVR